MFGTSSSYTFIETVLVGEKVCSCVIIDKVFNDHIEVVEIEGWLDLKREAEFILGIFQFEIVNKGRWPCIL